MRGKVETIKLDKKNTTQYKLNGFIHAFQLTVVMVQPIADELLEDYTVCISSHCGMKNDLNNVALNPGDDEYPCRHVDDVRPSVDVGLARNDDFIECPPSSKPCTIQEKTKRPIFSAEKVRQSSTMEAILNRLSTLEGKVQQLDVNSVDKLSVEVNQIKLDQSRLSREVRLESDGFKLSMDDLVRQLSNLVKFSTPPSKI